jgi:perosamine synthetase
MLEYQEILLEIESPVSEALTLLNVEGTEVLFIVDKGVLKGSLTNGDIRRALARGSTIRANITDFMNPNPHFIFENASPLETYRAFSKGVACIPILDANRKVVEVLFKSESRSIPIAEPNLGPREIELVNETLTSNWISSSGIYVQEFEESFSRYTCAKYVFSVCNGKQAIALSLAALGIQPGDEVIVPDLTFCATANAVWQVGAIPVFADVD